MAIKKINGKLSVRCGVTEPTPYLRKNANMFEKSKFCAVDIGCGNGRNSEFLKSFGHDVISFDMVGDYGTQHMFGKYPLPLFKNSVDLILANFIFMFLNKKERKSVIKDLKKAAKKGCVIVVELYTAKDSYTSNDELMLEMQEELFDSFGWEKIKYTKGRFIAQNN